MIAGEAGLCLPPAGLAGPDPRCALPHVLGQAVEKRVDAAMASAFAFGGANACRVVERG